MVAGFIRNKIFAIYLTLGLFGILSLMQQSASLLFTFFAFGLPLAYSTISAQNITAPIEKQRELISKMVALVISIAVIAGLLITVVYYLNPQKAAKIIVNSSDYERSVVIILFSGPLSSAWSLTIRTTFTSSRTKAWF